MYRLIFCVIGLLSACGGGSGSTAAPEPSTQPSATYSISGIVTAQNGAASPGVELGLSGARSSSTVSGANGAYSFSGLAGGMYAVTATAAGATFLPLTVSVTLQGQSVSGINFARTSQGYASTQLISDYMAALHAQTRSTFAANEITLSNDLASQGSFYSGAHYTQSSSNYVALVRGYANDSLAFVRLKSQSMPIDSGAVSTLFSTYAAQDASYADTYYRGVAWGLTGTALTTFVVNVNKSTNDIYALIILQLP